MILLILCCFCFTAIVNSVDNPQINTSDGQMEGTIMKTKKGREFIAFQGIPFAEPPLGELRFKAPVPVKPWKGVLDATKPHEVCPQLSFFKLGEFQGDENCLYLNVFTPELPSEADPKLLPVVVYIHGGAFFGGSATIDFLPPKYLLDKDIVLVTANYRLGALGFLSTDDDVSPGNYGLKDQSLALKWVNRNIKYFGGDPESVTISGTSAGGASSHFHLLSPLSKGLFKGVMSQSGTAFCTWALNSGSENTKNAKKLAENFDCPTTTSSELVDCLRNVDPMLLVKASDIFVEWNVGLAMPFRPSVELPSPEAFLADTPINLFKSGNFNDVPWMTGITKDEGIFLAADFAKTPERFEELNKDFNNKMAIAMLYKYSVDNPDLVSEKLKKFYFGNENNLNTENALYELIKVYGDAYFATGLDEAIRIHLEVSKYPVYNYMFAYESEMSISKLMGNPLSIRGVSHGEDLLYVFPMFDAIFPQKNETKDDVKITALLTTLWENFAKTGNPTPKTDNVVRTKWEPVESENLEYYYIDSNVQEMRASMLKERLAFWRSLTLQPRGTIKEEL